MTHSPSGARRGGLLRVLMGTVLFIALLIFSTGMASLLTSSDPIEVPSFGQLPGVIGVVLATAAFLGAIARPVLRGQPGYRTALWAALACYLAYLFGVFVTAVLGGQDAALAASVVGRLAAFWCAPVVALSAWLAAAGVIAITLSRERGVRGARWPWEHDEHDR